MTEKEMSKIFRDKFKRWFSIDTEVRPDGSRKRIDLIMTLKLDSNIIFGVELKNPKYKTGYKFKNWIEQAIGYSDMTFYGERIPIFIYPAISSMFIQIDSTIEYKEEGGVEFYPSVHVKDHPHHNLNPIVGTFGLGEIRRCVDSDGRDLDGELGYAFIYNNGIIWHESSGINRYNYNKLIKNL